MGLFFFEVIGQSMWPFLRSGQKVIVRKITFQDLKIGDLLLYKAGNQTVCHRLIRKEKSGLNYSFYCRGDLSLSPPEKISAEMVLGRVCGIIRKNQIINLDAKSYKLINRIMVIFVPLVTRAVSLLKKSYPGKEGV